MINKELYHSSSVFSLKNNVSVARASNWQNWYETFCFFKQPHLVYYSENIKWHFWYTKHHVQELRMVREELSLCQGQLRLLEAELRTRPPVLIPQETEHRLSNLTKTLILKQTALESTNIKCNQLRMQVEELEVIWTNHSFFSTQIYLKSILFVW